MQGQGREEEDEADTLGCCKLKVWTIEPCTSFHHLKGYPCDSADATRFDDYMQCEKVEVVPPNLLCCNTDQ